MENENSKRLQSPMEGVRLDALKGVRFDQLNETFKIHSDVLESIRPQLEAVSKSAGIFHDQFQKNLKLVVEVAQDFQNQMDQNIKPMIQVYQDQAKRWQSILRKIPTQYNFEMAVPRAVHPHVENLASYVHEMIDEEDRETLPDIFEDPSRKKVITWRQALAYLYFVFELFMHFHDLYSSHQTSQQLKAIEQNQRIIIEQVDRLMESVDKNIPESEGTPVDSSTEKDPAKPE